MWSVVDFRLLNPVWYSSIICSANISIFLINAIMYLLYKSCLKEIFHDNSTLSWCPPFWISENYSRSLIIRDLYSLHHIYVIRDYIYYIMLFFQPSWIIPSLSHLFLGVCNFLAPRRYLRFLPGLVRPYR